MVVAAFSSNFSNVTHEVFAQITMQMAAQFFKIKRLSKLRIFFQNAEGIFLVGHSFLHKTSHYYSPLQSSRHGIVCARRLSQLQRWPIKSFVQQMQSNVAANSSS
jgi:hypothetical protein